jgi:tetratricopeptide (TPR) repeat protein
MLPERLVQEVKGLIAEGDRFLDAEDYSQALTLYKQALSLIPEPQYDHSLSLDAFLAVGEALFFSGRYSDALSAFKAALKCPGGVEDPLVHLRLGETYYELEDLESAGDELTKAYMLARADIFEDEDTKYFSYLATLIDM